jgi:hypothetical protein
VSYVFIGLQLYCEIKWTCIHPLNYIFAYHIDSTTLADGDYELIPEQEVGISEDSRNIVGNLTEAPNQSSENFDTPAPSPANEGKPDINHNFIYHTAIISIYICIFVHYVSRNYFEILVAYS